MLLRDDGRFPNNGILPLLVYPQAVEIDSPGKNGVKASSGDAALAVERIFHANGWGSSWRNGVYPYQHYHSTAHEVLGVYAGSSEVLFGGDQGLRCVVRAGDVVLIPAGVAHVRLAASADFRVVGAYPAGQQVDMRYGREGERPEADESIARVPIPDTDPVFGERGPVIELWRRTSGV